ncbi:DNA cytosine methyltransferase [Oxalobacteraceae bacterium R-40]|uniref:Cytosine-specific methyltransferase n=1 Tax=Keguizhuia sedimenti TaxID=3064264 RepID=A0ABU1BJ25_9BURK|nr:DNA cytosine methyltransferase [Oxalobacteraceae bacterium R-40]
MKCVDLFAGVGGMSLGFENAGCEVVLAVEKFRPIAEGYTANLPHTKMIVAGVEQLNIKETFSSVKAQGVDIVFGGPPCQGFSQKGKRLSISDDRNFLFKYFVDVVSFLRPRFFVIENVPNILTTANSFFYNEIEAAFAKLGYELKAQILNAADYGVPQQRKRAFIVGQLGGNTFEFPMPVKRKVTVSEAISDLPAIASGEGELFYKYPCAARSDYQRKMRKNSNGIVNHQATKHSQIALQRLAMISHNGGGKEHLPEEHLTKSIYSGTWMRLREEGLARTITTRFDTPSSGQFTLPRQDRCLTVREAARLQSFPDRFIFTGTKSNQMLQVGNAVPPLLAQAVATRILKDYTEALEFIESQRAVNSA